MIREQSGVTPTAGTLCIRRAKAPLSLCAIVTSLAAGSAFGAAATTYTWTGEGDGVSWSSPANWGRTDPGDYPHTATDAAKFTTAATVTFDGGANMPIHEIVADGASTDVTLNAAPGSSMQMANDAATTGIKYNKGGKIRFNVPMTVLGTGYHGNNGTAGEVHLLNAMTNTANVTRFSGQGDFYLEGNFSFYTTKDTSFSWEGNVGESVHPNLYIRDNAEFTSTANFNMPGDGSTKCANATVVQDGEHTKVDVAKLTIGAPGGSIYNYWNKDRYTLKSGSLKATTLQFGLRRHADFVQLGGSSEFGSITFGTADVTNDVTSAVGTYLDEAFGDRFAVLGGTMKTKGTVGTTARVGVELSNCTWRVEANTGSCYTRIDITGPVVFDVDGGVTVDLCKVRILPGGSYTKTGSGTLHVSPFVDEKTTFRDQNLSFHTLGASSRGTLRVEGGSLSLNGFTSNRGVSLELKDTTLEIAADGTMNSPVKIEGTVTINVPSGKKLIFAAGALETTAGCKIVKTGAGELELGSMVWRGDLDVTAGTVFMGKTTDDHYVQAPGDATVHKIWVRSGAVIRQYEYGNFLACPVDYHLYDGGYIRSDSTGGGVYARHLWTNDVPVARGAIRSNATSDNDGFYRNGSSYAARNRLAITYNWTGNGANDNWSNPDNWEDGAVPPNGGEDSTHYADISTAEHITLDCDPDIGGFINMGLTPARTTVIESDGAGALSRTFSIYVKSTYFCGYVARDATTEFRRVKLARSSSAGNSIGYIVGQGTILLTGDNQATYRPQDKPYGVYRLVYKYTTNTAYTATFGGGTIEATKSSLVFGEGVNVKYNIIYAGESGHTTWNGMTVKDGAKVGVNRFYVSRHHQNNSNFHLDLVDGDIDVLTDLALGTCYAVTDNYRMNGGEWLRMSGGTITTPVFKTESNANHAYLNGGDFYLGAGGTVITDTHSEHPGRDNAGKVKVTLNAYDDPVIRWNGTTIHATATQTWGVPVNLVGESTLDVASGATVTLATNMLGAAAMTKTGAGAFEIGWQVPEVSMNVAAGTLRFAAGCDTTPSMKTLVLAGSENLVLGAGQSLKVERFVVNGVERSGTVAWDDGEVVVGGSADWLAAAAYTQNYVATCDTAKEIGDVSYSYLTGANGRLTISGSGSLEVADGAVWYVGRGDTLVVTVPVTFLGRSVVIRGGGDVIFESTAPITAQKGVTAAANDCDLYVRGGSMLVLRCEVNERDAGLNVYAVTEIEKASRWSTVRFEAGAYLKQQFFLPTCPEYAGMNYGGELQLAGGVLEMGAADSNSSYARYSDRTEVIRVCGGTFRIPRYLSVYSSDVMAHVVFESGRIDVTRHTYTEDAFSGTRAIELAGAVTLGEGDSAKTVRRPIAANFTGAGSIVKDDGAEFIFTGSIEGITNLVLGAGSVTLRGRAARTANENLVVDAFSESPGALVLDSGEDLRVKEFVVDGRSLVNGTYEVGAARLKGTVAGSGTVTVTGSPTPRGTMILFR